MTEALRALAQLERLVANPIDVERELWRAARHRYAVRDGRIHKVRAVGGASFLTGTQTELVYVNVTSGTAKNTFTTEAVINDEAGMGPQANLPPYFFPATAGLALSKSLRVVARGLVSDTATPTFTFTARSGAKASTAGPIIGGTGAITGQSAISNQLWEMEWDIVFRALGTTAGTSTIQGAGMLVSPGGFTSGANMAVWGGAAQPGTVATFDNTITNYINFDAACSASSASNGVTLLQLLVAGLN